jgi:predicted nucleotidyltransferase
MGDTAFLSVRLPESTRNRVKAVAAQRGQPVQELITDLIERFLQEAERQPPLLADVLKRLRAMEAPLRDRDVTALWIFGSVARGDARPDSDVDLAVEFAPDSSPSLFDIVRLKDDIEAALGRTVDLGERSAITARVAAAAERDMVRVF